MSKILVVTESIPNLYHGGGGVTAYSVIGALIDNGHNVLVACLSENNFNHNSKSQNDHISELEKLGVEVRVLNKAPKINDSIIKLLFPKKTDVFSGYLQKQEIAEISNYFNPEAIFAYHWNAIASLTNVKQIPILGIVGDPIHLPLLFRKSFISKYSSSNIFFEKIKIFILEITRVKKMKYFMNELLMTCSRSGAFAYHHANEFKQNNILHCDYYCTPVPDPLIDKIPNVNLTKKFKIIHIGHLSGIATLSGIELLVNEVIPNLDKLIGPENYELHIIGGYFENLPASLKNKMTHESIIIRGQINPADDEFLSADIVIVPTPIKLGIRVRIVTAFSFGCCIVAHEANSHGIPELENGFNCMLSDNGYKMAEDCHLIYKNHELKLKLKENARKTYLDKFSLLKAGNIISNTLIKMIN
jgi:glycosyltransferase involved in cell wall biosynthesis